MTGQAKIEIRKKKILAAAEKVFARQGFQDATISEIAKEAKISEASIYEYFNTKEGLLFSIPGEAARQVFDLMDFHLRLIRGAAVKLRAIIYILLSSYQKNPDFASVLMLLLKHNKNFMKSSGYEVIREGIRNIDNVLEEGIASGEFRPGLNVYLIRSVILGAIEHLVTNWVMKGDASENLTQLTDPLIDTIIEGIRHPESGRRDTYWELRKSPVPPL